MVVKTAEAWLGVAAVLVVGAAELAVVAAAARAGPGPPIRPAKPRLIVVWLSLRLDVLLTPIEEIDQTSNWRRKQADLPSRAEAIRRLVELTLKAKGK
ncbi:MULTISPECIES: hypothetical protein [unclassified Bradyrhizobium]|uniref:hypothetical protein n=1 Tax=unclassified Bradyrhizobium TaxID=2631580 RepID=UPI0003F82459|nr:MULTISPECIES: hypothetical protein [unclassified Bradyrhizobium]QIG97300.1 hypothetical protein G6P99_36230 [Bradyrhizobium sp. 6(2017)]